MSRKQKSLRAFLHQHKDGCPDSYLAGWETHKGIAHAQTIQEKDKRIAELEAKVSALELLNDDRKKLEQENERLREQLDLALQRESILSAYEKDAERYRWLRDSDCLISMWGPATPTGHYKIDAKGKQLDAAIDAERKEG